MRKIVWSMPVSLDGYVEGPHGRDWVLADQELHDLSTAETLAADTLLFGRGTYELFVQFWPTAASDPASPPFVIDYANAINRPGLERIVYSRTLKEVGWNARLVPELVASDIQAMQAGPGRDIGVAGPLLGSSLARLGLVDVFELMVHPVVLGSGKRMFADIQHRLDLKLTATRRFDSGVVVLTYHK